MVSFLFLTIFGSCIDPYVPRLKNYNSLLVVNGLVTNENLANKIKLYRTTSREDSEPEKVTDAYVYITNGDGIRTDLQNCRDGVYCTDSTSFTGVPGMKYKLHILTSDDKEYESDECLMVPVTGIDKVYYEKGEEVSGNIGDVNVGIYILLNSSDATGMNQYFRWTFEETWKINIPNAPQYTYQFINDTTYNFTHLKTDRICWKQNISGDILTNSILSNGNSISGQKIKFIAPLKSDRLNLQYSILVKQYSISKKEFMFWENLQKTSDVKASIFSMQPYSVLGNIHNVNGDNEMVLGYFGVSAVCERRLFINPNEIRSLNLPNYKIECNEIAKCPDDWPKPINPWIKSTQPTWDGIYHIYTDKGEYSFIRPEVLSGTIISGNVHKRDLQKLVFAPKVCAICEYSGITAKPDFWINNE